jgi:hypothetical protein
MGVGEGLDSLIREGVDAGDYRQAWDGSTISAGGSAFKLKTACSKAKPRSA